VKINLHAKLSGRRRGKDRGLIGGLATSASSRIQKIEKKKKGYCGCYLWWRQQWC
jgi:hypothetical protein